MAARLESSQHNIYLVIVLRRIVYAEIEVKAGGRGHGVMLEQGHAGGSPLIRYGNLYSQVSDRRDRRMMRPALSIDLLPKSAELGRMPKWPIFPTGSQLVLQTRSAANPWEK